MRDIYDKVSFYCKNRGISISEFEKRCHLGNGTVGKWKLKNLKPSVTTLNKLSEATNLPLTYWLGR